MERQIAYRCGHKCVVAVLIVFLQLAPAVAQVPQITPPPPSEIESLRSNFRQLAEELNNTKNSLEAIKNELSDIKSNREIDNELADIEAKLGIALATLEETKKDADALKESCEAANVRIQENENSIFKLYALGSAIALAISLGGALLGKWATEELKTWARGDLLSSTKTELNKQFEMEKEAFDVKTTAAFERLNHQISDLVVLIRASEDGRYEDAVEAIDWDGTQESLKDYPVEIRKLIISSILLAQNTPGPLRQAAWDAAEQILSDQATEANLAFLYELSASSYEWTRGHTFVKRYSKNISITSNPQGFLALLEILRRNREFPELLRVEEIYKGRKTDDIVHYLGHIRNNVAQFEAADELLRPQVELLLKSGGRDLRSNWAKLFYSFVKNCDEWGKPEEGIEAARFAIRWTGDSLLQLGVLRLALHLEALGKGKLAGELFNGVQKNLAALPEDVATWQITARLMAREHGAGKIEAAIKFLRENKEKVDSGEATSMDPERAKYFFSCLIGELLIRAGRFVEARSELHAASLNDNVGEAYFLIAYSHAKEKHVQECADFLDRAGMVHPRWCRIAQLRELYPEMVDSIERSGRRPCEAVPGFNQPTVTTSGGTDVGKGA